MQINVIGFWGKVAALSAEGQKASSDPVKTISEIRGSNLPILLANNIVFSFLFSSGIPSPTFPGS
jgi:hypothetical protein